MSIINMTFLELLSTNKLSILQKSGKKDNNNCTGN